MEWSGVEAAGSPRPRPPRGPIPRLSFPRPATWGLPTRAPPDPLRVPLRPPAPAPWAVLTRRPPGAERGGELGEEGARRGGGPPERARPRLGSVRVCGAASPEFQRPRFQTGRPALRGSGRRGWPPAARQVHVDGRVRPTFPRCGAPRQAGSARGAGFRGAKCGGGGRRQTWGLDAWVAGALEALGACFPGPPFPSEGNSPCIPPPGSPLGKILGVLLRSSTQPPSAWRPEGDRLPVSGGRGGAPGWQPRVPAQVRAGQVRCAPPARPSGCL